MLRANPRRRIAARAAASAAEKLQQQAARRAALIATPGRMASMGPAVTTAAHKTVPARNRALLDMAEGRSCLLRVPIVCIVGSTVACHSNLSIHGKAGARKADDMFSAWGCPYCHRWLDQGSAPAEEKLAIFMAAHYRQVHEWRRIAADPSEPERFRRAAQWALDRLAATPVIDLEAAP